MNILLVLIPVSLILGGVSLIGFIWCLRAQQYDDPKGAASRILIEDDLREKPDDQTEDRL